MSGCFCNGEAHGCRPHIQPRRGITLARRELHKLAHWIANFRGFLVATLIDAGFGRSTRKQPKRPGSPLGR